MITIGGRTRGNALVAGQLLALIVLVASNRALLDPTVIVHKSQDSKRPKTPKKVVPEEPVRIPTAEKESQGPGLARPEAAALHLETAPHGDPSLPRTAFTQLTKPDYLRSDAPGSPHVPLSPPV